LRKDESSSIGITEAKIESAENFALLQITSPFQNYPLIVVIQNYPLIDV
jgi:hypothetical protein